MYFDVGWFFTFVELGFNSARRYFFRWESVLLVKLYYLLWRFLLSSVEMRKAKRVRFDDAESDAYSTGHEAIQSLRSRFLYVTLLFWLKYLFWNLDLYEIHPNQSSSQILLITLNVGLVDLKSISLQRIVSDSQFISTNSSWSLQPKCNLSVLSYGN